MKLSLLSVGLFALIGCDGSRTGRGPGNSDGDPLAGDVTIGKVTVSQGVNLLIAQSGQAMTPTNAPVVAGREALVRLYVNPSGGYVARPLTAVVTVDDTNAYTDTRTITAGGTDDNLDSTFHIQIPANILTTSSKIRVAVTDTADGVPLVALGDSSLARWPTDGSSAPLSPLKTGRVRVTLVPIAYYGDGSGRLPDTSAAQLEVLRKRMYESYPSTDIELTVRSPYSYNSVWSDQAFNDLNDQLVQVRADDGADIDMYYYGLIAPARSFAAYCGSGCVTGLTFIVSDPADAQVRVGSGIGFTGSDAAETFIHEIGHAHGRYHAPCEVSDPDPNFPYAGGVIGVLGYSVLSSNLYDPQLPDFMGYCQNPWVSDYTYKALATRIAAVNSLPGVPPASLSLWQSVHVGADGTARLGTVVRLGELHGTVEPVDVVDAHGSARTVVGRVYEHGHGGGRTMFVPLDGDVRALRVAATTLSL
jgi:hypothetical protein